MLRITVSSSAKFSKQNIVGVDIRDFSYLFQHCTGCVGVGCVYGGVIALSHCPIVCLSSNGYYSCSDLLVTVIPIADHTFCMT